MIHPTAIIDDSASIGNNVSIGPYTVVGPHVEIGDHCVIGPHVVLRGPTVLGQHNRIYQFASVGEDCQDKKYQGEPTRLVIGDYNVIREGVTIHRGTVQDQGVSEQYHVGWPRSCGGLGHFRWLYRCTSILQNWRACLYRSEFCGGSRYPAIHYGTRT